MRIGHAAWVLVGCLAATGCGGPPATHYYLLQPAAAADVHRTLQSASGLTIAVEPFRVDPPYDQDRIVYRVGADSPQVGFYAYHRWAAPLERMLPALVASSLEGTAGVTRIEPAASGGRYGARLRGRLLTLEEVDGADAHRVRVLLALTLVLADGTELWSRVIRGEEAFAGREVEDVVDQMRATLAGSLADTRDDLARALRER